MKFKKKGLPVKDELVICTVKRINPNSAIVELDEYEDVKGMVHISEVALKGVKNIKNHLSVGKRVVCKVLYVKDDMVDVSLKRVKSGERKEKLNENRVSKRFYHLIEHACKEAGVKIEVAQVAQSFIDKYGTLFRAYEVLKEQGLKFLQGVSLNSKLVPVLKSSFKSLLKQLKVSINRLVIVSSKKSDGVERIKELLTSVKPPKDVSIELGYKGSGEFILTIEAINYKRAEECFDELREELRTKASDLGVRVSFSDEVHH